MSSYKAYKEARDEKISIKNREKTMHPGRILSEATPSVSTPYTTTEIPNGTVIEVPSYGNRTNISQEPVTPTQTITDVVSDSNVNANYADTPSGNSIDSYETFLKNASSYFGEIRKNAITSAEEAKKASYANAEKERQRGVVDARSSFAQNKATYGANAETIGGMGLSGSGYSDYIDSKAYATQRAETQAANAQATYTKRLADETETQAKLAAETTYQQNMYANDKELAQYQVQKAQQERENYIKLLELANSGTITADQAKSLAASYGLSSSYTTSVGDAATAATNKTDIVDKVAQAENAYNMALETKDVMGIVNNYVDYMFPEASDEQKQTLRAENFAKYASEIDKETAQKICDMNGTTLTSEGINKIKTEYSKAALEKINNFQINNTDGTVSEMSDREAKELYEEIIANPLLTDDARRRVEAAWKVHNSDSKNVVNVYTDDDKAFGLYAGTTKKGSEQTKYVKQIMSDAENGVEELKEGMIVDMNYGSDLSKVLQMLGTINNINNRSHVVAGTIMKAIGEFMPSSLYEYKGNGVFERVKFGSVGELGKFISGKLEEDNVYIPDGYKKTWYGSIKTDS